MRTGTTTFRQVLVKVHSRCNLACRYCYIYEFEDQSWRDQPGRMSRETIDLAAKRIAEHARRHELPELHLILHGGEPLLAGAPLLEYLITAVRDALGEDTRLCTGIQTNGLLLDDGFVELFERLGVTVGVSLDGGQAAHDRHRRTADGRGSYERVARGIRLLQRHPSCYGGILATIDLRNDPVRTYTELMEFSPPRLDFLLPHGNWVTPPPGRDADPGHTPYADWLLRVFDHWYPSAGTRIRIFESLMSLLLGGPSRSESTGLDPVELLTIETDGSIEQGDVLKVAGPGMAATGMHLATHSLDEAATHPGIQARTGGLAALADQCRRCSLVRVCGGGHYAHRYNDDGSGFRNPSVYCPDLTKLINHIRDRMTSDLSAWRATG